MSGSSLDNKLAETRKPVQELVRNECIHLGLLTSKRAEKLATSMAGKPPEQAEADIIEELRNNLHKQIQAYIRKQKGGPWKSIRQQEDVRVDIVNTRTVRGVLTLTRQLLAEQVRWEEKQPKGLFGNLFSGVRVLKAKR